MLQSMAEPLAKALGPGNEVVIHDLAKLPNSIVAISGDLTGRTIGGPATDLLLQQTRQRDVQNLLRYRSITQKGVPLISSTIFVKDKDGLPIASLCINTDQSLWLQIQPVILPFTDGVKRRSGPSARMHHGADGARETFPNSVEKLIASMVDQAIEGSGVPVELMQRAHKMAVVGKLEAAGVFLIRDAVDYVAIALHVTRFTVYNYLSEIREQASGARANGRRATMKRLPLGPVTETRTAGKRTQPAARRSAKPRGTE